MKRFSLTLIAAGAMALGGCKGGDQPATPEATKPTAGGAATGAQTGENLTPDAGGKVVVIELMTAGDGTNRFLPSEVMANHGDVLRFTLKVGVHNVDFLADSNPGKTGLPAAPSDMLQLPGQTYDVKVSFAPGNYYFQCDPHALLGMRGHLMVH